MSKSKGKFLVISERGMVLREISAGELDVMQDAVGGYVELFMRAASKVRPGVSIDFWCNEEGKLIGLPGNAYVDAGDGRTFDINGPVLVTAGTDEGETIGLTEDELKDIVIEFPQDKLPYPVVRYA